MMLLALLVSVTAPVGKAPLGHYVQPADMAVVGHEGIVGVQLTVDYRGRINRCDITESSGQAILDATTCSILTRRARFDPARDEAGAPVEGKVAGKIEWKVPR